MVKISILTLLNGMTALCCLSPTPHPGPSAPPQPALTLALPKHSLGSSSLTSTSKDESYKINRKHQLSLSVLSRVTMAMGVKGDAVLPNLRNITIKALLSSHQPWRDEIPHPPIITQPNF